MRVALTSSIDFEEHVCRVGLAILAFRRLHTCDHEHWEWHYHSLLMNVSLARYRFEQDGGSIADITTETETEEQRKYRGLQKRIYSRLQRSCSPSRATLINKLRSRLARWHLPVPLGHVTQRALRRLLHLKGKVKPAAFVAYFKLLLNGWNTGRRFRGTSASYAKCAFCKSGADSIEHFAYCPVVRATFARHSCSCTNLLDFLALDQWSFPHQFVIKTKLLSALYIVHNSASRSSIRLDVENLIRAATSIALR